MTKRIPIHLHSYYLYPMPYPYRLKRKTVLLNALTGYILGLGVISLFISGIDHPKPEWGQHWMIRPLIITPLVSAAGALALLLPDFLKIITPWKRLLALFAGLILFMITLWLGIIVGLDGTLWN